MKWYSVNEFKIPINYGYIFVALEVDEMCTYKIAEYRYNPESDLFNWFCENGSIMTQVKYFCLPDPIPS